MNQEPDCYEPEPRSEQLRQTGGAAGWTAIVLMGLLMAVFAAIVVAKYYH